MTDRTTLDPTRTAVLVMDYQHGIVDRFPQADKLLAGVERAVDGARRQGAHVGWVRAAFDDDDFAAIPDTSVMAAVATPERRSSLHSDAPETQIHPQLQPQPSDIQVRKTRVGAFTTTDLDRQLRDRGIDTLVLAGLSTSGVVLSTVREAMDRDYRIVVVRNLVADFDTNAHDVLVDKIFARYADVVTGDELAEMWPSATER